MLRADYFGHAARIQASSLVRPLGEVIAVWVGWRSHLRVTVRSWSRSPGHGVLLLDPEFRRAGAGIAFGYFGRLPATAWTVHLGG
jgi:uncharacterized protein YkwD